jgi:hypothetical protein
VDLPQLKTSDTRGPVAQGKLLFDGERKNTNWEYMGEAAARIVRRKKKKPAQLNSLQRTLRTTGQVRRRTLSNPTEQRVRHAKKATICSSEKRSAKKLTTRVNILACFPNSTDMRSIAHPREDFGTLDALRVLCVA